MVKKPSFPENQSISYQLRVLDNREGQYLKNGETEQAKTGDDDLIEHMCFFVCKANITEQEYDEIMRAFRRLKGIVPGILEITIGLNVTEEIDYKKATIGMRMLFENRQYLREYLAHPEHVKAAEILRPAILEISVCDIVV